MSLGARASAAWWLASLLFVAALPEGPGLAPAPGAGAPRLGAARLLWGLPLDLNRENARALEALPGIGPTRAQAIVAARPFCRPADLARVPGIGPVTLRVLRGKVAASGPKGVCGD